jgi:hypothetical protein
MPRAPTLLLWISAIGLPCRAMAGATEDWNGYDFKPGDPHAHDGWASGDAQALSASLTWNDDAAAGDYAAIDTTAFTDNGLSWFVLANHVNGKADSSGSSQASISDADGGDTFWRDTCDDAYAISDADHLALCGAEVFFTQSGGLQHGHRTLIFFTDTETDLATLTRDDLTVSGLNTNTGTSTDSSDVANCAAIETWSDGLEASYGPIALVPHHPAAMLPMATNWACHSTHDLATEVYGMHGNSDIRLTTETPAGSLYDKLLTNTGASNASSTGTVNYWLYDYYLNASYPSGAPGSLQDDFLAIVGGTDSHRTRPGSVCLTSASELEKSWKYGGGITMAMIPQATTFSREALYDAFVARRTYATSGPHIPVLQTVWNSGGTTQLGTMGDVIDLGANTAVKFKFQVPASGATVWEDDVAEAWVVKPTGANTWSRAPMTEISPGVWTANLTVTADNDAGTDKTDDVRYVMIRLVGEDAHPSTGCEDGGSNDDEYVWTSPTWFK